MLIYIVVCFFVVFFLCFWLFVCVGGKTPDVQKMTYADIMQQQELRREEVNTIIIIV